MRVSFDTDANKSQ